MGIGWVNRWLIGMLACIGYIIAFCIGTLAYDEEALVSAARLGVLLGSGLAMVLGLGWGLFLGRRHRRARAGCCTGPGCTRLALPGPLAPQGTGPGRHQEELELVGPVRTIGRARSASARRHQGRLQARPSAQRVGSGRR